MQSLVDSATWRSDPIAARTRALLDRIPDGATVAAENRLAPQLTARCTVYLFPTYPAGDVRPDFVAVTEPAEPPSLRTPQEAAARRILLQRLGYVELDRDAGVVLLRRN